MTMGKLEILQRQFEDAAGLFPGLTAVSEVWPKESGKFRVLLEYQYNSQNLIKLWENKAIHETEGLSTARRYWLIKPEGEEWSKESAYRRLRILAEEGVVLLQLVDWHRKKYMEKENLDFDLETAFRTPIFLEGEEFYNEMSCAQEWVLRLYGQAEDPNPLSRKRSTYYSKNYSWVEDVFYQSAVYCRHLMYSMEQYSESLAEKAKETGQGKKRRGAGERDKHVEEAYKALGNSSTTQAKHLARWINNKYDNDYWKMKAGNVMKSQPWKKHHPKKK